MPSAQGGTPLVYRRLSRAEHGEIRHIHLDPSQVERFLGPLTDILATVRRGQAHALFAIMAGGEPIGFYVVHPDARDRSCWWLGWLALDQRQQGRGFGRCALLDILASLRRLCSCERVRLLVSPDNAPAQSLYGSAGFIQVGRDASTQELVLELNLSPARRDIRAKAYCLARTAAGAFRKFRHRRLRITAGPHAAWVIGVERGPPSGEDAAAQDARFALSAFSERCFQNSMSASLLNMTRTPRPPLLTRILPPLRAR